MPQKGDTQINTFVGGLITEASPLSFPPGASLDEINMKLLRSGSRERRLGLDYEDGFVLNDTGLNEALLQRSRQKFFRWVSPSGSNKVEIGVIQVGSTLFFIDLFQAAPSTKVLNGGFGIEAGTSNNVVFDFAVITNRLLVVAEELEQPYLLSYDEDTELITAETERWNIRDFYGVQDDLTDNERPTTLSKAHEYNLRNQGWHGDIVATGEMDALKWTFEEEGWYPSNSDTWSLGKIEDASSADVDKYDPATLKKNSFDLGRAARGHFVIDLYNRGSSRLDVIGIDVPALDRELGRISTVASYAGRGFYSGIRSRKVGGDAFSPDLSSAVLFSQVMESPIDLIKCYQKADPTSPEQSDIVATDGGVIIVSGAVDIVKLIPIKTSLFVFASNGVWEIKGDDGGFKADAYQVTKITSSGVFSRDSIVDANGTIIYWGIDGIFSLAPEQVSGSYESTNITMTTIQKLYNSIPNLQKQNARGYYDESENTVRWLYSSDEAKVLGDPIDIQADDPPTMLIGDVAAASTAGKQQPIVVPLTSTTFALYYRNTAASSSYYKIGTIDTSDMSVTYGAETLHLSGGTISSYALTSISSSKVLLIYKLSASSNTLAIVGDVSGDVITWDTGGPTTIDTTHTGDLARGMFELAHIAAGKCVFGAANTDNNKVGLQVVTASLVDNSITFGTVAKSTHTNATTVKIGLLTSAVGIVGSGGVFTNTAATVAPFTISGTTITFETSSTYSNASQHPSGSRQFFIGDIAAIDNTKAMMIGGYTLVDGATTHGVETMNLAYTSGAPGSVSSTTSLNQETALSSPTTQRSSITKSGSKIAAIVKESLTPNTVTLYVYTVTGATPSLYLTQQLNSIVNIDHPNSALVGSNLVVQAYTNATDINIEAVVHRIV